MEYAYMFKETLIGKAISSLHMVLYSIYVGTLKLYLIEPCQLA